ncbi:hypothetical protein ACJ72_01981 [Emergomyces africanus]|uniref:Uncharacterized protein n=1 Tax=Emergomyces africanus TaxID=1955775 RepID=A0A1B7P3Q1_9EURO|nr:hypothetical protein ACJ72_01981 [Emergomyces africanus]
MDSLVLSKTVACFPQACEKYEYLPFGNTKQLENTFRLGPSKIHGCHSRAFRFLASPQLVKVGVKPKSAFTKLSSVERKENLKPKGWAGKPLSPGLHTNTILRARAYVNSLKEISNNLRDIHLSEPSLEEMTDASNQRRRRVM